VQEKAFLWAIAGGIGGNLHMTRASRGESSAPVLILCTWAHFFFAGEGDKSEAKIIGKRNRGGDIFLYIVIHYG